MLVFYIAYPYFLSTLQSSIYTMQSSIGKLRFESDIGMFSYSSMGFFNTHLFWTGYSIEIKDMLSFQCCFDGTIPYIT